MIQKCKFKIFIVLVNRYYGINTRITILNINIKENKHLINNQLYLNIYQETIHNMKFNHYHKEKTVLDNKHSDLHIILVK